MKLQYVTPDNFEAFINEVTQYAHVGYYGVSFDPEIAYAFGFIYMGGLTRLEGETVVKSVLDDKPFIKHTGIGEGLVIRELVRAYVLRQLEHMNLTEARS